MYPREPMTLDLTQLEAVFKLMSKYQISRCQQHPDGSLDITKSVHMGPKLPKPKFRPPPIINGWDVPNPDTDPMFFINDAPNPADDPFAPPPIGMSNLDDEE
jgi:hypothetical protein